MAGQRSTPQRSMYLLAAGRQVACRGGLAPAACISTHFQVALSCEASVVALPRPSSANAAAASSTAACWTGVQARPRSHGAMLLSSRSTAACCALLRLACAFFCEPPPKKLSSARGCTAARLRDCEPVFSRRGALQAAAGSSRVAAIAACPACLPTGDGNDNIDAETDAKAIHRPQAAGLGPDAAAMTVGRPAAAAATSFASRAVHLQLASVNDMQLCSMLSRFCAHCRWATHLQPATAQRSATACHAFRRCQAGPP